MIHALDFSDPNVFAPAKFTNFSIIINIILPIITAGAALIFLARILTASFKILTHGDVSQEIEKAKNSIAFAVLGLIIVITSFLAVSIIGKMLGISNILPY